MRIIVILKNWFLHISYIKNKKCQFIIEVKSDYTFEKEKEINILKGLEVSNYYLFQLYIVSRKGKIQTIIEMRNGIIYSR